VCLLQGWLTTEDAQGCYVAVASVTAGPRLPTDSNQTETNTSSVGYPGYAINDDEVRIQLSFGTTTLSIYLRLLLFKGVFQ
jgi:hypothetical protein